MEDPKRDMSPVGDISSIKNGRKSTDPTREELMRRRHIEAMRRLTDALERHTHELAANTAAIKESWKRYDGLDRSGEEWKADE